MTMMPAWVQILSALLTPSIAVAVAVIAHRQWRTARDRLVLDLFEKRLAVYQQVKRAVAVVNTTGKNSPESDRDLLEAIEMSEFLFGEDVRIYLSRMWEDFLNLRVTQVSRGDTEEVRRRQAEAALATYRKIINFYYEGADVFAPYMRMDHKLFRPLRKRRRRPEAPPSNGS